MERGTRLTSAMSPGPLRGMPSRSTRTPVLGEPRKEMLSLWPSPPVLFTSAPGTSERSPPVDSTSPRWPEMSTTEVCPVGSRTEGDSGDGGAGGNGTVTGASTSGAEDDCPQAREAIPNAGPRPRRAHRQNAMPRLPPSPTKREGHTERLPLESSIPRAGLLASGTRTLVHPSGAFAPDASASHLPAFQQLKTQWRQLETVAGSVPQSRPVTVAGPRR